MSTSSSPPLDRSLVRRLLYESSERWAEKCPRQSMLPVYVLFTTFLHQREGSPRSARAANSASAEITSSLDRTPLAITLPLQGKTMKERGLPTLAVAAGEPPQPRTEEGLLSLRT